MNKIAEFLNRRRCGCEWREWWSSVFNWSLQHQLTRANPTAQSLLDLPCLSSYSELCRENQM